MCLRSLLDISPQRATLRRSPFVGSDNLSTRRLPGTRRAAQRWLLTYFDSWHKLRKTTWGETNIWLGQQRFRHRAEAELWLPNAGHFHDPWSSQSDGSHQYTAHTDRFVFKRSVWCNAYRPIFLIWLNAVMSQYVLCDSDFEKSQLWHNKSNKKVKGVLSADWRLFFVSYLLLPQLVSCLVTRTHCRIWIEYISSVDDWMSVRFIVVPRLQSSIIFRSASC